MSRNYSSQYHGSPRRFMKMPRKEAPPKESTRLPKLPKPGAAQDALIARLYQIYCQAPENSPLERVARMEWTQAILRKHA